MTKLKVTAHWSGEYPNLCSGSWSIKIGDKSLPIPANKIHEYMDTEKTYSYWTFDEDWSETWDDVDEGLYCGEWIDANKEWIDEGLKTIGIQPTNDIYQDIYWAVNEEDWRHGTCGGCR